MIYNKKFEIRLKDIGKDNEMTNVAILNILENVAAYHSDSVGIGVNTTKETMITWVLLDWKLNVIKRPKYGHTLNATTWARYANKCYSYRDFEIYDDSNNLCVIATSKWLLIDLAKNKLAKIDDDLIQRYEPEYGKSVFNILELDKLNAPQTYKSNYQYTTCRSDIDVNKHMHNLRYLDLAYEALPYEVYNGQAFNDVRITYKKEVKLGDVLNCKYCFVNNKHIVGIYNNEGNILHSLIVLS